MATVKDVAVMAEKLFPAENVCMQDYIGLSVGDENADVDKVIVCLDCTETVIDEAVEKGAQMIFAHHPLIFGTISSVTKNTPVGRIILSAAKNGINVYSAHTNMDCSRGGITGFVANIIGLKNAGPLIEINSDAALGLIGNLEKAVTIGDYAGVVGEKLCDRYVKVYGKDKTVRRIAVVNGAGGDEEIINAAIAKGADVLVTGEIKHHVALYARAFGLDIIEVSHYASEHIFIPRLSEILNEEAQKNNLKIQFTVAESESNPAL